MKLAEYLQESGESQARFGGRVGVRQSAVGHWLAGRERPKAELVLPIAAATGWRVTPHELRPDIYPHPDDGMPKNGVLPLGDRNEVAQLTLPSA